MEETMTIEENVNEIAAPKKVSFGVAANPFGADASTKADEATMRVIKTDQYPYIDADGTIKIGIAVTIKEDNDMSSMFGDGQASEEAMVIISADDGSTIKNELGFAMVGLNAKMKVIPQEVFDNLANVKKTVTLSKPFKNLLNSKYANVTEVGISQDEINVLSRALSKTKELSDNLLMKISENVTDDLEGFLTSYEFKKHLLITGDAGEGKTYIVDKYLKDKGIDRVMYIAHTGTEAIDLIGHYIKKPDGTFIWKDGTFSKAFRLAQNGPTAYFIDEMLRMPARELNILVGSLTPDSSGNLRLRTDRHVNEVHGIAETEELVCPMENLWVVSTTNQGSGYQSARIDEALKDRFRLYYQKMGDDKVEEIITGKMAKHKASGVATKSLISLIQKTTEIKETGNIPRAFTIRHLSEAVDNAKNIKDIKKKLFELIPNIVSIDSSGEFNKEQVEIVRGLIKKTI